MKAIEGGMPVAEASRRFGVSRNTLHAQRKKYAGMQVSDAKKLRGL